MRHSHGRGDGDAMVNDDLENEYHVRLDRERQRLAKESPNWVIKGIYARAERMRRKSDALNKVAPIPIQPISRTRPHYLDWTLPEFGLLLLLVAMMTVLFFWL